MCNELVTTPNPADACSYFNQSESYLSTVFVSNSCRHTLGNMFTDVQMFYFKELIDTFVTAVFLQLLCTALIRETIT